ncbi:MAG: insulinase family protein [Oscillospiraceae bacterium]|jgi:predicted Zn-dependent peptidase|nr:insulinase family protein [Oscillospiraceae bacterium]
MYDDSPEWRVMFNMLEAMYHNHPVKIDIAGTVESISKITAQGLYDCYNTFYNLHNMVLCVCGGTTPEEVLNIADDMLKAAPKAKVQSYFEDEPYEVKTTYVEQAFPVTMELFNLGFKEKAGAEQISNKLLAQTEVLLAAIASSTADLYRELMDEGLINQSFSYELFEGPGFLSVIFGGESRNPKGAAKKIKEYIAKVKQTGISKADFEISKKALYGDAISALNSVDTIGNMLVDSHFTSREFFGYVDEIAAVTFEEANNRLKEILDVNNTSLSIITKQ